MTMAKNTSNTDRAVRLIIGVVLLVAAFTADVIVNSMPLKVIVIAFATMNFISASTSFCPVYFVAGISTAKDKQPAADQST